MKTGYKILYYAQEDVLQSINVVTKKKKKNQVMYSKAAKNLTHNII